MTETESQQSLLVPCCHRHHRHLHAILRSSLHFVKHINSVLFPVLLADLIGEERQLDYLSKLTRWPRFSYQFFLFLNKLTVEYRSAGTGGQRVKCPPQIHLGVKRGILTPYFLEKIFLAQVS